ncbi:5-formyltetrahydrofolate cyclo-ligase [Dethiobacter alkaliphilus]|uniref:5-formyltetrahydrofolate cyclo-ligase n=1 Tax=Dethiobacter alkaliphilus AHT 1 TaxID=555088 RepID=C0GH58_DETAL|nr:5-formyltetrahydrofolate cyclo-ligase [Dethiobacter alkaliphilus]EEG77360.1 5-formyltetrahydrofolate cyclo-ligase [Dethiobacter alkaliphilus AHT 1]
MEEKKTLRKDVLCQCDLLTEEDVISFSNSIAEKLFSLPEYQAAKTIMYYANFNKEVVTLDMIPKTLAEGKRVIVPKTVHKERRMILSEVFDVEDDLTPGLWNIPEPKPDKLRPVDVKEIDFVVVPGVAFDEQGNRLGYGGGYYDRFFQDLRPDVPLVAVTYELQMVEQIPVSPWDRTVDLIITEKRVIDCRKGQN